MSRLLSDAVVRVGSRWSWSSTSNARCHSGKRRLSHVLVSAGCTSRKTLLQVSRTSPCRALTRCRTHASAVSGGAASANKPGVDALIRNIGVMAHIDAGKTTVTERMLFYAGIIRSIGNVDDGTTQMDFMEEERSRGITIASATTTFPWKNHRVNLIDTPGHVDFTVEVECALRVLDGAVALFDGVAGVQAQTLTVWRQARKNQIPTIAFVNKMDRDGACLIRTVKSMKEKLSVTPLILQSPIEDADGHFCGNIDFVSMRRMIWSSDRTDSGTEFSISQLEESSEDYDVALLGRGTLIEQLADLDDDFAEIVLSDDFDEATVDANTIKSAIRRVTLRRSAVPVLCGTARRNKGVQPLMDAVVDYLPSPGERPLVELKLAGTSDSSKRNRKKNESKKKPATENIYLQPTSEESLCALVFKIIFDPHRGALAFARVYSGVMKVKTGITNSTKNSSEKINRLLIVNADDYVEVDKVMAGNIVALVGLKNVSTGDTLVAHKDPKTNGRQLHGIDFPVPVFTCSIEAESSRDVDNFEVALERIQQEDPSVRITQDEETGQTLMSGMGELHLQIVLSRIQSQYKVNCVSGPMKVAYREAPSQDIVFKHNLERVVGGKTQSVTLELVIETGDGNSACEVDTDDLDKATSEFELEARSAAVQGILATCSRGVKRGYPIIGATIGIRTLEYLPETTLGIVALCAAEATRKAMLAAEMQMLQPMMKVDITVDGDIVGDVLNDLSGVRQATVFGISSESATTQSISAEVALRSMVGYDSALRSLTSGTGAFLMSYDRHQAMNQVEETSAFQ